MKKQLALAALITLASQAATYAATPVLNLENALRGKSLTFGYTETQNVTVKGFQAGSGEEKSKDFLITSPLLKDASDVDVEEYSILISKKPISSFKEGSGELAVADFDETKHTLTADDKATSEIRLKLNSTKFEENTNYYGVVVPTDDNIQEGSHSKEFCFNFSNEKYAEGEDCKSFGGSKVATDSTSAEENTTEEEHGAAGADMRLANISHTVTEGNKVILTWKALTASANVEIQLFDKELNEFKKLATVPMTQEKFEYQAKDTDQELIFNFVPKDEKGKELRYELNARTETEEAKPEIKAVPKVGPVEDMMLIVAISVLAYAGYRLLATNKAE